MFLEIWPKIGLSGFIRASKRYCTDARAGGQPPTVASIL